MAAPKVLWHDCGHGHPRATPAGDAGAVMDDAHCAICESVLPVYEGAGDVAPIVRTAILRLDPVSGLNVRQLGHHDIGDARGPPSDLG